MIQPTLNIESPELNVDPVLRGIEDFIGMDENEDLQYFFVTDHLGSSSYITDAGGDAVQHLQYMSFGEHFVNQTSTSWETPYKFSGKEKDAETGYSYFGARYYDSDLSIWLSVDPLAGKFPHISPYAAFNNNPIIYIDPDGRENVVVIGGADKGQQDRYKFINSGLGQATRYHGAEKTTIILVTANMTADEIKSVQQMAQAGGINFVSVGSAAEVANYFNSQTTTSGNVSQARLEDKITDVDIFGHGIPGSMEFGYDYVSGPKSEEEQKMSFGSDLINQLNPQAFDDADISLYTCNSATDANGVNVAKDISKKTNSTVSGYKGQSSYKGIYGIFDRMLKKLGTNILPASNKPEAGQGAVKKTYTNGTEQ